MTSTGVEWTTVPGAVRAVVAMSRSGAEAYVVDGAGIEDLPSWVREFSAHVPLDPPLVSGHSLDAISDSLFGGLADRGDSELVILWTSADVLRDRDAPTYQAVIAVLEDVVSQLRQPRPRGAEANLRVFLVPSSRSET